MSVAVLTSGWAVVIYILLAVVTIAAMVIIPQLLGQRHRDRTTEERYESGLPAAGDLPQRFSVDFFLLAILFVVFDLEAVFIFAWAVAARPLGWTGYIEIVVVILLVVALAYLWRTGALDWGTTARLKLRKAAREDDAKGRP